MDLTMFMKTVNAILYHPHAVHFEQEDMYNFKWYKDKVKFVEKCDTQ